MGTVVVRGGLIVAVVAVVLAAGAPSAAPAVALPGENGKIAFTVGFGEGTSELYVVNADGSGATNLTNNPADDITAAWSPDGTQIAFASDRDGDLELYVMNADGGAVTRLTESTGLDCCAAWSPDGAQLAFHSNRDGDFDVYVMEATGGPATNLTNAEDAAIFDGFPAWSPDGSRIAFGSDRTGNEDIYVMNADGSSPVRLTDDADVENSPSWSPDGSKIAFARHIGDDPDAFDVVVMDVEGGGEMNLTLDSPAADANASWSPDGTQIVFSSDRGGTSGLYVMGGDGSNVSRIYDTPEIEFDPDWQPLNAEVPARPTSAGGDASPEPTVGDVAESDDGDRRRVGGGGGGVRGGAAVRAAARVAQPVGTGCPSHPPTQ